MNDYFWKVFHFVLLLPISAGNRSFLLMFYFVIVLNHMSNPEVSAATVQEKSMFFFIIFLKNYFKSLHR